MLHWTIQKRLCRFMRIKTSTDSWCSRALDFQIYSLKNEPIVACSTSSSHNFKESINHLTFNEVISKVNELFAVDVDYGLRDSPLFLIFRLHHK